MIATGRSADEVANEVVECLIQAAPYVGHARECADIEGDGCDCGFHQWVHKCQSILEAAGVFENMEEQRYEEVVKIVEGIKALPEEESKKLINVLKEQLDDNVEAEVNAEDAKEDEKEEE